MKKDRKRIRHDYSEVDKAEANSTEHSKEFYGLFVRHGRIHVDVKRFKKKLNEVQATEFWRDEMCETRNTPYLIPKRLHRSDYSVNICVDIIDSLKQDWRTEYLPALQAIRSPREVYENARLGALMTRSGEDAVDEARTIGLTAAFDRQAKYSEVIASLYCSFVQKIATECDRTLALVFRKRGSVGDAFTFDELLGHLYELAAGDKTKKLQNVKNHDVFQGVRKIDNFLKHNTVRSFEAVRRFCPERLIKTDMAYENGMYAVEWLVFPDDFIEKTLEDLRVFFIDFCKMFFGEDFKIADWNYDDYFYSAYREICDLLVYMGIYDRWGNCLVG